MTFEGTVWRHIPSGGAVFDLRYAARARGRWNRAGVFGAIYCSLSADGARAEYRKYLRRTGLGRDPVRRDLVPLRVEIRPVADLTDPDLQRRYGIDAEALTADDEESLSLCRAWADLLRADAYQALLVPSAAAPGERNLVIYFDGPTRNFTLDEAGDRIPLNYQPSAAPAADPDEARHRPHIPAGGADGT